MNQCDHGHETTDEIRRLPYGSPEQGGAILVCFQHYIKEMAFRWNSTDESRRVPWRATDFSALEVVQPEVEN